MEAHSNLPGIGMAPCAEDGEPDISRELELLYRLADQAEPPARRSRSPWPSVAAIAIALGSGGAAYAARSSYAVAPGETLYQIASRHLGAGPRWVEIAALNGIKDPARVRAGQAIILPDPRERVAVRKRPALRRDVSTALRGRAARKRQAARPVAAAAAVQMVPPGEVILELPGRRTEARTAARMQFPRPREAERVRPLKEAEFAAPLPAPAPAEPVSPWRAVDGAAFLVGALGVTGLLTRAGRRAARADAGFAQAAAQRQAPAAGPAGSPDFWGPLAGSRLPAGAY